MTKLISQITALVIVFLAFTSAAHAVDMLNLGPKIGEQIPHTLDTVDQNKKAKSFNMIKGKRGLVLMFSRSFDW